MLQRLLSGDSLSPDSFGSTTAPEVVIRQVGESVMQVWDIQRGQVLVYRRGHVSHNLLRCFDPKKSLYIYEPADYLEQPFFECLPSMCSVPNDVWRYQDLSRNGGARRLYMPTWTHSELQAVRNFVANRSPGQMPLSQEDISERFYKFGGIFRHIFAADVSVIEKEQKFAIQNLDPRHFKFNEIDNEGVPFDGGKRGVSHYVAQYIVNTEGRVPFEDPYIDIVSEGVSEGVRGIFLKEHKIQGGFMWPILQVGDMIWLLQENDRYPDYLRSMWRDLIDLCEYIVAMDLGDGITWQRKTPMDSNFKEFKFRPDVHYSENEPPRRDLIRLSKGGYPGFSMMYKTEEGLLYGLMVVRSRDQAKSIKIKTSTVDKWLESIGFEGDREKVRVVVIPSPVLADDFKAEYEGDGNGYPQLEVWKLPLDYRSSFK